MEDKECFNFLPFPTVPPGTTPSKGYTAAEGWPAQVHYAFLAIARGPAASQIASGEALADAIIDIRRELGLSDGNPRLAKGLSLLFDEILSDTEAEDFFTRILPGMAQYVLRMPVLVAQQAHGAQSAARGGSPSGGSSSSGDHGGNSGVRRDTAGAGKAMCLSLRILYRQQSGMVLMTQELAAAILCAAFFCLFPTAGRTQLKLPEFNFDRLYGSMYEFGAESQEGKLRCLLNYYSRIVSSIPQGLLSFERKVLSLTSAAGAVAAGPHLKSSSSSSPSGTLYTRSTSSPNSAGPGGDYGEETERAASRGQATESGDQEPGGGGGRGVWSGGSRHLQVATGRLPVPPGIEFWKARNSSLCPLKVEDKGHMEDEGLGHLQVDFANAFLGGGALGHGCVQEEILFVICPELIAGMLFMPAMEANETIEVMGPERFSSYSGYAATFAYTGDYQDQTPRDCLGRRRRHIVAMDALCHAGERQFRSAFLLREVNKAFCGFLDHDAVRGYTASAAFTSGDSNSPTPHRQAEPSQNAPGVVPSMPVSSFRTRGVGAQSAGDLLFDVQSEGALMPPSRMRMHGAPGGTPVGPMSAPRRMPARPGNCVSAGAAESLQHGAGGVTAGEGPFSEGGRGVLFATGQVAQSRVPGGVGAEMEALELVVARDMDVPDGEACVFLRCAGEAARPQGEEGGRREETVREPGIGSGSGCGSGGGGSKDGSQDEVAGAGKEERRKRALRDPIAEEERVRPIGEDEDWDGLASSQQDQIQMLKGPMEDPMPSSGRPPVPQRQRKKVINLGAAVAGDSPSLGMGTPPHDEASAEAMLRQGESREGSQTAGEGAVDRSSAATAGTGMGSGSGSGSDGAGPESSRTASKSEDGSSGEDASEEENPAQPLGHEGARVNLDAAPNPSDPRLHHGPPGAGVRLQSSARHPGSGRGGRLGGSHSNGEAHLIGSSARLAVAQGSGSGTVAAAGTGTRTRTSSAEVGTTRSRQHSGTPGTLGERSSDRPSSDARGGFVAQGGAHTDAMDIDRLPSQPWRSDDTREPGSMQPGTEAAAASDGGGGVSSGPAGSAADGAAGVEWNGSQPFPLTLGVATGNWGCGAFGGDVELKAMLQWIAASEAGRPSVLYFTFGDKRASRLQEISEWILHEGWTVGELWTTVTNYCRRRTRHETSDQGLFDWMLPRPERGPLSSRKHRRLRTSPLWCSPLAESKSQSISPLAPSLPPKSSVWHTGRSCTLSPWVVSEPSSLTEQPDSAGAESPGQAAVLSRVAVVVARRGPVPVRGAKALVQLLPLLAPPSPAELFALSGPPAAKRPRLSRASPARARRLAHTELVYAFEDPCLVPEMPADDEGEGREGAGGPGGGDRDRGGGERGRRREDDGGGGEDQSLTGSFEVPVGRESMQLNGSEEGQSRRDSEAPSSWQPSADGLNFGGTQGSGDGSGRATSLRDAGEVPTHVPAPNDGEGQTRPETRGRNTSDETRELHEEAGGGLGDVGSQAHSARYLASVGNPSRITAPIEKPPLYSRPEQEREDYMGRHPQARTHAGFQAQGVREPEQPVQQQEQVHHGYALPAPREGVSILGTPAHAQQQAEGDNGSGGTLSLRDSSEVPSIVFPLSNDVVGPKRHSGGVVGQPAGPPLAQDGCSVASLQERTGGTPTTAEEESTKPSTRGHAPQHTPLNVSSGVSAALERAHLQHTREHTSGPESRLDAGFRERIE